VRSRLFQLRENIAIKQLTLTNRRCNSIFPSCAWRNVVLVNPNLNAILAQYFYYIANNLCVFANVRCKGMTWRFSPIKGWTTSALALWIAGSSPPWWG
jgi:hypothetical protein